MLAQRGAARMDGTNRMTEMELGGERVRFAKTAESASGTVLGNLRIADRD